ncbi:hypothetical protein [Clostridium sp. Marseille-P2415]|nr:hypothetical protein [Clostridium sp. Marseille-P2415]
MNQKTTVFPEGFLWGGTRRSLRPMVHKRRKANRKMCLQTINESGFN